MTFLSVLLQPVFWLMPTAQNDNFKGVVTLFGETPAFGKHER